MLCIITVSHNRAHITARFAENLSRQYFQNFHLILVDDGSTDGTSEKCQAALSPEKLTIIRGSGKLFWGGGLQTAYKFLKQQKERTFTHVLICNDDILFGEQFLEVLLSEFKALPKMTLFHAMQYFPEEQSVVVGYRINWRYTGIQVITNPESPNVFPTRALLMRADEFVASGGFRPRLLKHYRSDWEYTYRLYKRGYHLTTSSKATIEVPSNKKPQFEEQSINSFNEFVKIKWSLKSNNNIRSEIVFNLLCAPVKYKFIYTVRTLYVFSKSSLHYAVNTFLS